MTGPGIGQTEAKSFTDKLSQTGESPRFWRLQRREAYALDCAYDDRDTDYAGRKRPEGGWKNWTPATSTPFGARGLDDQVDVRSARPDTRYALCGVIVQEFTSKIFGSSRFPRIVVADDPASEAFARDAAKQAALAANMIEARDVGGRVGSVLLVLKLREGKYRIEAINPKLLKEDEIQWADRDEWLPRSVAIQYKYWQDVPDEASGRPKATQFWFRREISDLADITYLPVPVKDGVDPKDLWKPDPDRNFPHSWKTFPGVFIQNIRDSVDMDSLPDFEMSIETQDRINEVLSQRHRALHENLDPVTAVMTRRKGTVVDRGAGQWVNLDPGDDVKTIGPPIEGFEIAKGMLEQYRQIGLEQSQCVILDSEKVSGAAQSAQAMEFLYGKMLDRCDTFREQYGAGIVRLVELMLLFGRIGGEGVALPPRMVPKEEPKPGPKAPPKPAAGEDEEPDAGEDERDDAGEAAEPELVAVPNRPGPGGTVTLQWGPYFPPTLEDVQKAVTAARDAKTNGLFDSESLVKWLSRYFGSDNVAEVMKKLKAEESQRQDEQAERMEAMLERREAGGAGGFGPRRPGAPRE